MIAETSEARLHCFGSACHLVVDNGADQGSAMLALAREELSRLEEKFSSYHPGSVVSSINQGAGTGSFTPLDAESRSLFSYVAALWSESKHLFDPTTHLLQNCYDASGRLLASEDQLRAMLKLVGWSNLEITSSGARLTRKGMLIDLNDCVRPYAVDSVRKLLLGEGISNALIEMDHDIATIGKQPDGSNWMVGVRHPRGSRAAIIRLKLNHKGFAMRGDFEHCIPVDGENYGRGLSPVDGRPIPGLLSVALIADNCLTACSAASVARFKTEQAGLHWLENLGLPWMAIDRKMNCHGPLSPRI